jgi:hypothetical protein
VRSSAYGVNGYIARCLDDGVPNGLGAIGAAHRLKDWTEGCIAVTDDEIDEIWKAVPDGTQIEIRP